MLGSASYSAAEAADATVGEQSDYASSSDDSFTGFGMSGGGSTKSDKLSKTQIQALRDTGIPVQVNRDGSVYLPSLNSYAVPASSGLGTPLGQALGATSGQGSQIGGISASHSALGAAPGTASTAPSTPSANEIVITAQTRPPSISAGLPRPLDFGSISSGGRAAVTTAIAPTPQSAPKDKAAAEPETAEIVVTGTRDERGKAAEPVPHFTNPVRELIFSNIAPVERVLPTEPVVKETRSMPPEAQAEYQAWLKENRNASDAEIATKINEIGNKYIRPGFVVVDARALASYGDVIRRGGISGPLTYEVEVNVPASAQVMNGFLSSPTGAFTFNLADSGSGGIVSALVDTNDIGSIISAQNPTASTLGQLAGIVTSAGIGLEGRAIGGAANAGRVGSTAAERVSQVALNKAAGDAFEADVIANVLPKSQINIQTQITIKSSGPSGLKVRLDALGEDMASGATRLSDMKASEMAPFTPNQAVVYPELELYGGVVAGKGKTPYEGGTNIPPTAVDVIRKVN